MFYDAPPEPPPARPAVCQTRPCWRRVRKRRAVRWCLRDSKCVWRLRFRRLSSGDRAWAVRTGGCESGNVPWKHDLETGVTYHGAFQFRRETARAAGFTRDPHLTTWYEQAVRSVRWRNIAGRGQWPRCG